MLEPGVRKDLPLKNCRRVVALTTLLVAVAATVATMPASAQSYRVTVQLPDGTLQSLVMDLPDGTTVDQLVGYELPGTPVSLEAIVADAAQDPVPTDPAPTDPPPTDPEQVLRVSRVRHLGHVEPRPLILDHEHPLGPR